jgi:hypothetical protein
MLLIGFAAGGLITALTVLLMCEDTFVEAMDVLDERASESSEPKTNSLTLEIGVGYDENDNIWKL